MSLPHRVSAFGEAQECQIDNLLAQWQHGSSSSHLYFLTRHLSQARAARRRLPFLGPCCCWVRLLSGKYMMVVVLVGGDGAEVNLMSNCRMELDIGQGQAPLSIDKQPSTV